MLWKTYGQHKLDLISEQNKINTKDKMLGGRIGNMNMRTSGKLVDMIKACFTNFPENQKYLSCLLFSVKTGSCSC